MGANNECYLGDFPFFSTRNANTAMSKKNRENSRHVASQGAQRPQIHEFAEQNFYAMLRSAISAETKDPGANQMMYAEALTKMFQAWKPDANVNSWTGTYLQFAAGDVLTDQEIGAALVVGEFVAGYMAAERGQRDDDEGPLSGVWMSTRTVEGERSKMWVDAGELASIIESNASF